MTYLGTRPILQDELLKYELHHRARIAIKPGITGMFAYRVLATTYSKDKQAPVSMAYKIYDSCKSERELYIVSGSEHKDPKCLLLVSQFCF